MNEERGEAEDLYKLCLYIPIVLADSRRYRDDGIVYTVTCAVMCMGNTYMAAGAHHICSVCRYDVWI